MQSTLPDPDGFFLALPSERVKIGRVAFVQIDNQPIALIRIDGQPRAFSALCPHQLGDLSRGSLHDGEIECPVHGWRFDIRTGRSVYPEAEALHLHGYEVKEEDGMIKIKVRTEKQ